MKNVILLVAIALLLLNGSVSAQNIVTQNGKDTAQLPYTGGPDLTVQNPIKSGTSNNVVLNWNVIPAASRFDAGWSGGGVCDNVVCYSGSIYNGVVKQSAPYDNSAIPAAWLGGSHDFHVIFNVDASAANGSMGIVRVNAV